MNYLLVGLGNIGPEYELTRHNIGFLTLDRLADKEGLTWKSDRLAFKSECKHKGRTLHLIKPTTYMNLSGKAVNYWMKLLNIPKENILVIVDDMALPFEKVRMRPNLLYHSLTCIFIQEGLKQLHALIRSLALHTLIGSNYESHF
jgi:PTH1 family peptidyl-tRNA hydrolase